MHPTWNLDRTRFLTRRDLAAVLADAQAKAELSLNARRNLIIVLACCCWPVSFPAGLAAAVCGLLGLKSQNNKGQAVAGLAMGILALGLAGVIILAGFGNLVNLNQFR